MELCKLIPLLLIKRCSLRLFHSWLFCRGATSTALMAFSFASKLFTLTDVAVSRTFRTCESGGICGAKVSDTPLSCEQQVSGNNRRRLTNLHRTTKDNQFLSANNALMDGRGRERGGRPSRVEFVIPDVAASYDDFSDDVKSDPPLEKNKTLDEICRSKEDVDTDNELPYKHRPSRSTYYHWACSGCRGTTYTVLSDEIELLVQAPTFRYRPASLLCRSFPEGVSCFAICGI